MWGRSADVVGWVADATDLVAAVMIMMGFIRGVVAWLKADFGSGAMVVIRTVISFFLGKELESVHVEVAVS